MEEKELIKLQKYIGKRTKDQTTEEVKAHILKIHEKTPFNNEEWNKLLYPACSFGDIPLIQWLVEQGASLDIMIEQEDLSRIVIGIQEKRLEYQKERVEVIKEILALSKPENQSRFLNETLSHACWYNQIYVVEYLVNAGADPDSLDDNGKTPYEYAKIYGNRFGDYTLFHYLEEYRKKNNKRPKFLRKNRKLSGAEAFFTGTDMQGNTIYEEPK